MVETAKRKAAQTAVKRAAEERERQKRRSTMLVAQRAESTRRKVVGAMVVKVLAHLPVRLEARARDAAERTRRAAIREMLNRVFEALPVVREARARMASAERSDQCAENELRVANAEAGRKGPSAVEQRERRAWAHREKTRERTERRRFREASPWDRLHERRRPVVSRLSRPRRGPNALEIDEETTLVDVRWPRVVSVK